MKKKSKKFLRGSNLRQILEEKIRVEQKERKNQPEQELGHAGDQGFLISASSNDGGVTIDFLPGYCPITPFLPDFDVVSFLFSA